MSKDGGQFIKEKCQSKKDVYFHDVVLWGIDAMQKHAEHALSVFAGL
jgi:fructose-bisphosphate aldolase class II